MKMVSVIAAVAIAFLSIATCAQGDILVRNDGSVAEGKVISRDAKGVSFLPDGADAKDVR